MKRVEALDFARVISMLSVIMIHVTAPYIEWNSDVTLCGMNLAFFLNQACRFSVPLFVLLSGASLGLKGGAVKAIPFWKKRLLKIGVPYLVWFFLYELDRHSFSLRLLAEEAAASPAAALERLLTGQAAPHLYFIIIVLQLYLLYPLLAAAIRRSPVKALLTALLLTYAAQCLFDFGREGVQLLPSGLAAYLWLLFPTWLFYFVLGACCSGETLQKTENFCRANRWVLLVATAAVLFLFALDAQVTQNLGAVKRSLNLVVVLVLLASFALWSLLGRWQVCRSVNAFLAAHSMTVYFCHVLVLGMMRDKAVFYTGMRGMMLLFLADLAVSVLLAAVIDLLTGRIKILLQRRKHHG